MRNAILDELRELSLVGILIILLQVIHIISDVLTQDVVTVDFSIEVLALSIITRETAVAESKKKIKIALL